MLKKLTLFASIVVLAACSEKDSESDYKYSLMDSESIIAIAMDKAMTCKGHAMVDNFERAYECTMEYLPMVEEGSDYNLAAADVLQRVSIDEDRMKEPSYKMLLGNIDRVSKTTNYLVTYIESKNK